MGTWAFYPQDTSVPALWRKNVVWDIEEVAIIKMDYLIKIKEPEPVRKQVIGKERA